MPVNPDERLVVDAKCSVNFTNGKSVDCDAAFYIFLCDHCDNTHMVFFCEALQGKAQINIVLPPKDSERLGHLLINPQVAQET